MKQNNNFKETNLKKKKLTFLIIIFLLIILITTYKDIYNLLLKKMYPKKYSEYVEVYANEYEVDTLLIYSIIKAESNFNENAESKSGAKGLMQLMENTATELLEKELMISQEEIFEPKNNIMLGTKYYAYLYETYNNTELALAAYNAGLGNVNKWIEENIIESDGSNIENIPFKETNMYVRKIINNYKVYKKLYNN